MSPDREEAERLLRKADQDEAVVRRCAEMPEIADSIIGFHAQQAVEKSLKAVLAANGEEFPWTHDLRFLLERLDQVTIAYPDWVADARRLTPWAVEFRYGETVDDALDRAATAALVADLIRWARSLVRTEDGA